MGGKGWILQASASGPFDIIGAMRDLTAMTWSFRRGCRVKEGDPVHIWVAKGGTRREPGIYATGRVVRGPEVRPPLPEQRRYMAHAGEPWAEAPRLRVVLSLERKLLDRPLTASVLRMHPLFSDHPIFKYPSCRGTLFSLNPEQREELQRLLGEP